MKVEYALNFIKETLVFEAKKEIIDKYNANDSDIVNNFEYRKDGEVKFRHHFSAIDESVIINNLYLEMITVCVSQVPIKLLVAKGNGDDIIRGLNDDYDIRRPKQIELKGELDIDEPLALVCVYNTLDTLGVGNFRRDANAILSEYEKNLEIPDPRKVSSLAFRFSADKQGWHSSYQSGDNYFSIYQNDSWGEAIPLISGSGGGATSLTQLSDFPSSHQKGKVLVSNGVRLEWASMQTNSTQTGSTKPTNEPSPAVKQGFSPAITMPDKLDLSSDEFFYNYRLSKNTELKIDFDEITQKAKMQRLIPYKFMIDLNDFDLSFEFAIQLMYQGTEISSFSGSEYKRVIFDMIMLDDEIAYIYNLNYGKN